MIEHAFSCESKCGLLTNNLYEVFNATILEAREPSIIFLCEWIRIYVIRRFQNKRGKVEKFEAQT